MVAIANTVCLAGYVAVMPGCRLRAEYFSRFGNTPDRTMLACPAEKRVHLP
jgi:hypothetical protein